MHEETQTIDVKRVFDPRLASVIGLDEAILMAQLNYWIEKNEDRGRNQAEGRTWCYNSISNWKEENFPWMSESKIRRVFARLKSLGLTIEGNFNKKKYDQTKWYTINYDKLEALLSEPDTPSVQSDQVEPSSLDKPIPETNPKINNDIDEKKYRSEAERSECSLSISFNDQEKSNHKKRDNNSLVWGHDVKSWFSTCEENGLKPVWTKEGVSFKCLCPVHQEKTPSFYVSEGDRVPVITKCFGCDCKIYDAADFLFPQTEERRSHVYVNEHEEPVYRVCRSPDKSFHVEVPRNNRWVKGKLIGVQRVLYHLPRVNRAKGRLETIYIVEGEKDVITAEKKGLTATCNPFGSDGWRSNFAEVFHGQDVVIVRDKDPAGEKWAEDVWDSVSRVCAHIELWESPLDKPGADLTDHLEAGLTLSQFVKVRRSKTESALVQAPKMEASAIVT